MIPSSPSNATNLKFSRSKRLLKRKLISWRLIKKVRRRIWRVSSKLCRMSWRKRKKWLRSRRIRLRIKQRNWSRWLTHYRKLQTTKIKMKPNKPKRSLLFSLNWKKWPHSINSYQKTSNLHNSTAKRYSRTYTCTKTRRGASQTCSSSRHLKMRRRKLSQTT